MPWLFLCNLIFFCLCVYVGFRLDFLYVNSISFNRFLIVLWQTLICVSTHLFFICFVVHSIFSRHYCSYIFWRFDVFHGQPECFPFLTIPFLLYLPQFLDSWLGTTASFITSHCVLLSRIDFMILSIVSIDNSFAGELFPFNSICSSAC